MRTHAALSLARLLVVAFFALAGTSCVTPATEVLVVVDTDARSRVLSMRATVARGMGMSTRPEIRSWNRGADAGWEFPASFAIVPGSTPNDGSVSLEITVQFASATPGLPPLTAARSARFRFTPHVGTYVRIFIPLSCSTEIAPPARCADGRMPCSVSDYCAQLTPAQTCGDDGRCRAPEVMPQPLGPDASVPPSDATPDTDVAMDAIDAADTCVPECTGRTCGPNGCGGTCGACAAGQICSLTWSCAACTAGAPCDPGDPCATGSADCTGGAPSCTRSGNRTAGTACPGGVCNGTGTCVACSQGMACAAANPCATAQIDCATGAAVCSPTGNVAAGMPCPGGTCNGSGACVACSTGSPCSTGNPCTTGQIDCASGSPSCTANGNAPAGTSCPGGVCDGAGHCSGCSAGAGCTPATGECFDGAIDCGSGTPMCASVAPRGAGASCSGGVCNGSGVCLACAAGTTCSTGNECTTGQIACSTGAAVCNPTGNRSAGTPCSGGVCNGSGVCVACTTGAACTPANPCSGGVISCGTGSPVCNATFDQPEGTPCPGGVCDATATCIPCSPGAPCGAATECAMGGTMSCSGGPTCIFAGPRPEYTPCSGGYCRGGVCTPCTNLSGCSATGPGVVCNNDVQIAPYATGGPFGGFQSMAGTGFQTTIGVSFAIPVNSVSVTILDPDYSGNSMIAYDSMGTTLGIALFNGDGSPGSFSMDTQTISAAGISRVDLVPDPGDYVAYGSVSFSGCF